MSHADHLASACANTSPLSSANQNIWTVVGTSDIYKLIHIFQFSDTRYLGEWTAAENDCAYWLNGFGKGARYDGSFPGSYYIGSCTNENTIAAMSPSKLAQVAEFIKAQLDAFESASGWFFWAGKTESAELCKHSKDHLTTLCVAVVTDDGRGLWQACAGWVDAATSW